MASTLDTLKEGLNKAGRKAKAVGELAYKGAKVTAERATGLGDGKEKLSEETKKELKIEENKK